MTSKVRRAVVATSLAASMLVVGGIGVSNAWAQSNQSKATATPSASQSSGSGSSSSSSSTRSAGDCPLDGASANGSTSSDTSA